MKTRILIVAIALFIQISAFAQTPASDTGKAVNLQELIISSNRLPIPLRSNPGSVSIVQPEVLQMMPKTIGAEEALRLVPGVRIDNQHDGERVHLSIRGQGILTERGLRGIGVMLDGIPVNDPSGFAPDLYDVDWASVSKIEIMRGPAASLYGGSGAAGMISITTRNGDTKPFGGEISETAGSNGFFKTNVQLGGTKNSVDYRVAYSRTDGAGYRDHQAFWGNKLYEKITLHPSEKVSIMQIFSHTDYFQQNPEGLNLGQFNDLRQANPDACPFNEYQKTNRNTFGVVAAITFSKLHDLQISGYYRSWNYKETSNKAAEYRTYSVPGVNAQYNLHFGQGTVKNHISIGADFKWQNIAMYKLQSGSNPLREESIDQTNIELDSLLANQLIAQNSIGGYLAYKLDIGKFTLTASARYDRMNNELTNKMLGLDTATTSKNYEKFTARVGASYSFIDLVSVFANWSQGFLPPSTEELASNPEGYSGFNTHLVPATSNSYELGLRGFYKDKLYYEISGFYMDTKNDFFRFKQTGRGNQEVFYGNAGNSRRIGVETFISYKPVKQVSIQLAYTFADYTYTSATVDQVYTDTAYVLTTPPASGQWLPNSPKHQLFAEVTYHITRNFHLSVSTELQSKWAIYTDAKAYSGELDPAIYQNWQDGFNLYHARFAYTWRLKKLSGEFSVFARNILGTDYMAFTEPDPDGNSYQPGPGREIFGAVKLKF